MNESDLRFLYDQVLESFVRLQCFSVIAPGADDGEFDEDLDHMRDLLAKRDLLIFSATIRNFAESTKSLALMKAQSAETSELFLSSGAPFHRDKREGKPSAPVTLNLSQIVSRVLHAHRVDILCRPHAFIAKLSRDSEEYFKLITASRKTTKEFIEPLVFVSTAQEPESFILLYRLLESARAYLNGTISQLEKGKIFITRTLRDA
jgi:hypothetical protein